MIGKTNVGGGGTTYAFIIATYPAGSTCTCSDGTRTLRAKDTTGEWVFGVPYAATWTITSTDGTDTKYEDVYVTVQGSSTSVEISYSRVPDGYTEVEYLYSSGTQYVNTGYTPNANTTMEIMLLNPVALSSYVAFLGTGNGESSSIQFAIGTGSSSTVLRFRANTDKSQSNFWSTGTDYHVVYDGTMLTINDNVVFSSAGTMSNSFSYPIALFGWRLGSSYSYKSKVKLGEIIFRESGTIVRDLVPCKNTSSGEGYFYDITTASFCGKSGTLGVGPEV